jgi:hypothetical protein
MADKLSERLDDAWRKLYADGDEHDVCDTIAEAAELARRVEEGPREKVTHWEQAAFAKAGAPIPDEGSYVRLMPDTHTSPDPGHEQEGGNG